MIWIDGDACPREIKEIVYRVSQKNKIHVTFVANKYQKIPNSKLIKIHVVDKGFDKADEYITSNINKDDIVITADIPFAAEVIKKEAHIVTPAGSLLDQRNINERLSMRNFFEDLRSSGTYNSRAKGLSSQNIRNFANAIDKLLAKIEKK